MNHATICIFLNQLKHPFPNLFNSIQLNSTQISSSSLITCRRSELADAMGRLKLGPMDADGTGEGLCVGIRTNTHTHTHDLPRFRALVRR